jgi:hypothetical protein
MYAEIVHLDRRRITVLNVINGWLIKDQQPIFAEVVVLGQKKIIV